MADETNNLSVTVAPEAMTTKVSVDPAGKAQGQAEQLGRSMTLNTSDEVIEKDLDGLDADETDDVVPDAEEAPEDAPKEDPQEGDEPAERTDLETDLPEFDPANDEVRTAYDAKYLSEVDGKPKLNLDAFNAEAQAHLDTGKLDINKGSREWVKDTFGVDDQAIDLYLEGLAVKTAKSFTAIEAVAGGTAAYDQMVEWARGDKGYSQAQRDAFNTELRKGGEAAETAVALLKSRFERAGGKIAKTPAAKEKAEEKPQAGLRGKRPSSPARKVTGTPQPTSKAEGYKDSEDHRKAMLEAGDDPAKVAAVRARLRASSWFGQ